MMRVAYAFRPFPANYKATCDASLPASPTGNVPLKSSLISQINVQQTSTSSIISVNGNRYKIVRLLGEGLHSRVFAGFDIRLNRSVAIKIVQNVDTTSRNEHSKMFFKEIRYLTKLQTRNPYVVRVFDHEFDSNNRLGKIVMETGQDFRFLLPLQASPKEKQMNIDRAKLYWYQMVDAVASLHRYGIVHSDIKPENFIINDDGYLRIIDLGLSFRLPHDQLSVLRPFAGTPEYMPPEVCRIQNGHYSLQGRASDIWALGVLLFEMIFGYRPFEHIRDNIDKMSFIGQLNENISIPPLQNPFLADVLRRCLQVNPRNRPSADELLKHSFFDI